MSIIDTLITDRTQADVTKLKSLLSKPRTQWTNQELDFFLHGEPAYLKCVDGPFECADGYLTLAGLRVVRGAYNATDLNRVQEAMEYLAERFRGYGYNVPEIKRPSITEVIPGTSRLPEGYTELEYIRSTGEQYIDTEFKPNQDSRVVFRGEFPITADTQWLFGARVGSGSAMFGFLKYQSQFRFDYGNTNNYFNNADTVISVDTNKNNVVVNGSEILSAASQTFSSGYNLLLFANNNAGTVSGYAADTKCSGCQIYDNGILVRDYVPCLNPSNEVGLYDIVNGEFYGNAGTGYFLPGPVVSLPEGYTRLEYIESTGTQYINTLFKPNQDTRVVVDAQIADEQSGEGHLFSARDNATNGPFWIMLWQSDAYKTRYATQGLKTFDGVESRSRHAFDFNKNVISIDGVSITFTAATFQLNTYLPLFCRFTGTTVDCITKMKLYSCPIYDNDILTRLYTPCRNASGEAGLYDSITGEFYGNAGTGVFVAGDELGSYDGNIPTQIIERDYWKIGDIPRKEQMGQYLTNLGYVKNVLGLLKSTPESPSTMDYLTYTEANDIEKILVDIEFVITHTIQSMARLNAFMFVSGYRPFPSSASDYGRTWDDIDALELNWDDLDDGEAWYTMQYGVIK